MRLRYFGIQWLQHHIAAATSPRFRSSGFHSTSNEWIDHRLGYFASRRQYKLKNSRNVLIMIYGFFFFAYLVYSFFLHLDLFHEVWVYCREMGKVIFLFVVYNNKDYDLPSAQNLKISPKVASFKTRKTVRVFVYKLGRVLVKVSCWLGKLWQIKTKAKWRETLNLIPWKFK